VPVTPLTGSTRRRLAAAVGSLAYLPGGGTGLYDSVLAAVDSVRSGWDPTRVNSVVVLTDGKDEADADHRIPLSALLTALRQERASTRPVKVIAIAYGPDSDLAALRAISAASGGILYRSTDPRDLPKIFVNAVGHRLCGQACR
jgi:Mg-chelatase subunit ChlD